MSPNKGFQGVQHYKTAAVVLCSEAVQGNLMVEESTRWAFKPGIDRPFSRLETGEDPISEEHTQAAPHCPSQKLSGPSAMPK